MSDHPPSLKQALRQRLRAHARGLSQEELRACSESIRRRLEQLDIWRQAKSILFYAPVAGEPDIWPLLEDTLAAGKIATLPRYIEKENHYVAAQIHNTHNHLRLANFGIREPEADRPHFPLDQLDLVLVPGVAFDENGHRLGRGKGYYDRLLAHVAGAKVGLAFDWQVLDEVPVEPHDVKLNGIITPTRWLKTGGRGAAIE